MNSLLDQTQPLLPETGGDSSPSGSGPRPTSPSRPPTVRLGSLPMDSAQDLRFVQDRLALFGKTVFIISTLFLLLGLSIAGVLGSPWEVSRGFHLAASLVALAIWRAARARRQFSTDTLKWLDSLTTAGLSALFAAMAYTAAQPIGFYSALLAITHVNVARAVIVPSVAGRTLALGAASFAGLVASNALVELPAVLTQQAVSRALAIVEAASWSASATALAAVASHVIYGLQERALEARQLGQYTLEEKIGEGGMGEIYRARHAMLRRPTAVKLLTGSASDTQLHRFEKEVQLTAELTHPNTISVYDYGRTPDGTFYYAMEMLQGLTLEELIERHGPQPPGRVIHLMQQVCGALSEAHGVGLIHRDIKPANIYLCQRGGMVDFVKVLDFGLVRQVHNDGSATRSNVNVIVGTPLFLSPEAILSPESIDARADLYGLGGVMYALLTGSTPFTGRSVVEICGHQLHTAPKPLSERAPVRISKELETVVLACLAKAPSDRPQTAHALSTALAACEEAGTWREECAQAWWQEYGPKPQPAVVQAEVSPESGPVAPSHRRRTFCCGDVAARLGGVARS